MLLPSKREQKQTHFDNHKFPSSRHVTLEPVRKVHADNFRVYRRGSLTLPRF